MGTLLETPLVLLLISFTLVRTLKLGTGAAHRLLIGLASWDAIPPEDLAPVLAAGRASPAALDAAIAALRARKNRVWRSALTGGLPRRDNKLAPQFG